MDKNAIKKFAVWARTELIARVSLKGVEYGITEDKIEDANADSVGGKVLTADEKKQRQALIAEINDKGYKQVMEEVAYTWFNRFSALRFMEVNGYLPSHVRVFTDEENSFKPQIITEAIHLDLDGLDVEKVYELKDAEKTEELYKYLLIVQCNALNKILPGMFQRLSDYTELLLPDNLLREGSVIQQMIELIPEDDWKDAVQIIGWLYQYYNSEKKDDVFAALKKNVKITKENIPAATQLFTPDWIVRYFMTIPEASQLVLESGVIAHNGELLVLDMGKPIKILDLAENMIHLSGANNIKIVETGLRPGEKLYEELLVKTEELDKTENDLIFREKDKPLPTEAIREKLRMLKDVCENGDDEQAREMLRKVVPTFKRPEEVNQEVGEEVELMEAKI